MCEIQYCYPYKCTCGAIQVLWCNWGRGGEVRDGQGGSYLEEKE